MNEQELAELHHITLSISSCESRLKQLAHKHPRLKAYTHLRIEKSFQQVYNLTLAFLCELNPPTLWK